MSNKRGSGFGVRDPKEKNAPFSSRATNHESRNPSVWVMWCGMFIVAGVLWAGSRYYSLEINLTDSIPYRVLWLQKGILPHKGEWMSFVAPNNGVYPKNVSFTKKVVGVAGDTVDIRQREFWINNQYITYAKPVSQWGTPLALGPAGIIPPKHYFALALHQDSFDSRYHNIGWIDASQVLGTAIPLW